METDSNRESLTWKYFDFLGQMLTSTLKNKQKLGQYIYICVLKCKDVCEIIADRGSEIMQSIIQSFFFLKLCFLLRGTYVWTGATEYTYSLAFFQSYFFSYVAHVQSEISHLSVF